MSHPDPLGPLSDAPQAVHHEPTAPAPRVTRPTASRTPTAMRARSSHSVRSEPCGLDLLIEALDGFNNELSQRHAHPARGNGLPAKHPQRRSSRTACHHRRPPNRHRAAEKPLAGQACPPHRAGREVASVA